MSEYVSEVTQRQQLRFMRTVATLLLALMAVVFICAKHWQPIYPYLGAVAAFAEAAMVGALADWFAVTALFRYPFGIPIPHTAIIPNNKDRIAKNLGIFIEQNFFSSSQNAKNDLCGTLATWLVIPENSRLAAQRTVGIITPLLTLLRDTPLKGVIEQQIKRTLKSIDIAPLLGDVFAALLHSKQQHLLLDEILVVSRNALAENRIVLNEKLNQIAPWFIPNFISEKLSHKILERLDSFFEEVTSRSDHPARLNLISSLEKFAAKLRSSEDYKQKIAVVRDELLDSPVLHRYIDSLQEILLTHFATDLSQENSATEKSLSELFASLGSSLLKDESLRRKVNSFLQEVLLTLVNSEHSSLSESIAATVRGWETRTLVEKLELQVGKDLQFIRINGTIVGGCVGLGLYFLMQALHL